MERSQLVYAAIEEAYGFFSDPRHLPELTPAWMALTVTRLPGEHIFDACEIDYKIRWLRVPIRWTTVISDVNPPLRFVDQQRRGPYKQWWHEHRFERVSDNSTLMTDRIEYEMPLGLVGSVAHALAVRRQLLEILDYRAAVIAKRFPQPSSNAAQSQPAHS